MRPTSGPWQRMCSALRGMTAEKFQVSQMSTASSNSGMDFDSASFSSGGSGDGSPQTEGGIWLDGDVLACACPECGAPMSIRLWLMVADCFRCGTSIELSSEQEQAALRLLRQQEQQKRTESREAAEAISPRVLRRPQPVAGKTPTRDRTPRAG